MNDYQATLCTGATRPVGARAAVCFCRSCCYDDRDGNRLLIGRINAVVTAIMRMCDKITHRAFEAPLTQLTVNQAAGIAEDAAVQPAKRATPATL
jgi:hypothetical protein